MKGHFFRRGDTWSYTIDLPKDPATGKRQQKKKGGFKTKKEAQVHAAKTVSEIDGQTYVKESDVTFRAFSNEWLQLYEKTEGVKPSTVRARRIAIKRVLPYFAEHKLRDISRKMYQDAIISLQEKYKHNTISGSHITCRLIFSSAIKFGVIKNNPTDFAKLPKTQKTVEEIESNEAPVRYLEKDELAVFLEHAKKFEHGCNYLMFLVLAYSGLRIGELCALKWKDIDFKSHTLSVTKTLYNPENNTKMFSLYPPKTKASIRTVDIPPPIVAELKSHKVKQDTFRMSKRDVYFDGEFVFVSMAPYLGYPIKPGYLRYRMKRVLTLCGLDTSLSLHSLRHTHASLLAEAGVSLLEVMERLGHIDDKTTKGIYIHITKDMRSEASKKFNELMDKNFSI